MISANDYDGILLNSSNYFGPGSYDTVVQGNLIGTDATGTVAMGNANDGVNMEQAANSTIGGTISRASNVISGNFNGIFVATPGVVIQANLIGTDATGTKPLGNVQDGIYLSYDYSGTGTTIGGSTSGSGMSSRPTASTASETFPRAIT